MNKPPIAIKRMQMYATHKCQLECNFCPRSTDLEMPEVYMDLPTFKEYADKCIEGGITEFELSPLVGDPLLDHELADRILYLQDKPEVTLIFIFTNLLALKESFMDKVEDCTKFEFKLSIYGDTPELYKERTGINAFHVYVKKLQLLGRYLNRPTTRFTLSEIVIRFIGYDANDIKKLMPTNPLYKQLYSLIIFEHIKKGEIVGAGEDVNWVEDLIHVEETIHNDTPGPNKFGRVGACEYLIEDNGIWPNGDVGICTCWFDINKKMILGNINEMTIPELYGEESLFQKIKDEQDKGVWRSLCKSCSWGTKDGQV